jgi:hypothetical protein
MNVLLRLFRIGDQVVVNADGAKLYPELETGDVGIVTSINLNDMRLPYTVRFGNSIAYLDADTINLRYAQVYLTHGRTVRLTKRFAEIYPKIWKDFGEVKTGTVIIRDDTSVYSPTYEIAPHGISLSTVFIQPIFTEQELSLHTFLSKNVKLK